jgi:archaellum biogenesis ATPase FlaH
MGSVAWFSGWKFDPVSAVLTTLILPLLAYAAIIIRKSALSATRYVIEGFLYWISPFVTKSAAASLSLRRYCRLQLSDSSRYLYVPSSVEIHLDIDTIFVPLVLERAGKEEGYDHRTVLEAGNRIRIIGDPGSGKSSIAKRIFRDACRNGIERPRKSRLPILIELRRLDVIKTGRRDSLGNWLLEKLKTEIATNRAYDLDRCFDAYAMTNGLLIILDGLDEISTVSYSRVESAINGLSDALSKLGENNVIVLTMRTQFHYQVRSSFMSTFPVVLALKQFSPTDIYEFLRRWDFEPSNKAANIVRIYTDLTDQPTLREMCSNPLVLSMYVARDQAVGHSLAPESRSDFYSSVTEELLIKRRAVQVGAAPGQTVLRLQRQKILGKIAFYHLTEATEPANLLSWDKGITIVRDIMECE